MRTIETRLGRTHVVRMATGEDVLAALEAAVEGLRLRNAAILSGVGSVSSYHVHVVETTKLPPGNIYLRGAGPFDVLNVNGLIIDGRVHAHIALSDLEPGCTVLTFCAVVLAETDDCDLSDVDYR
jgi:predicted DNA-binding protein with PD1-like motif